MTVKTENQIWQSVFSLLNGVLTKKGLTDWTIRQGSQPTVEGLRDKSIYITRISSRRYGWQAHRNKWSDSAGQMVHSEEYFQEVLFQISAFHKRDISNIDDLTSGDILNTFITYLQSIAGVEAMRAQGFQTYRIQELREPPIVDDSEVYEKLPSFDISLVIVQNDECDIGHTDRYNLKLKGI